MIHRRILLLGTSWAAPGAIPQVMAFSEACQAMQTGFRP
jgi:TRAP-type C4-dicarboxylate transport system substrate-binding protein